MNDFNYNLLIGLLDEYSEMLKVVRDSEHELIKSDDEVKVEHLEQIGKMASAIILGAHIRRGKRNGTE